MAYFSNSDAGLSFEESICSRCIHGQGPDDMPCPVMTAHAAFQGGKGEVQDILDMLIAYDPDHNPVCQLFIDRPGQTPWDSP